MEWEHLWVISSFALIISGYDDPECRRSVSKINEIFLSTSCGISVLVIKGVIIKWSVIDLINDSNITSDFTPWNLAQPAS